MPELIFDSCVISNFALSDSLYIIKKLYPESSYVTDFVSAEITRGIHAGLNGLQNFNSALREGWLREITLSGMKERSIFETLSSSLGLGEASSIAASGIRGFIFASDDKAARKEARLLEIKLTGTVGILAKAVRDRAVSSNQADKLLNRMIDYGFYSPVSSVKEIL